MDVLSIEAEEHEVVLAAQYASAAAIEAELRQKVGRRTCVFESILGHHPHHLPHPPHLPRLPG